LKTYAKIMPFWIGPKLLRKEQEFINILHQIQKLLYIERKSP
jgi:hypothetical protein